MIFGIHNYTAFIAAVVAFQLIPGPATLTILNATARYGPRSGMGAVFGTLTGDMVFMLSAVLGLAALLATRPLILESVQWVGIGYLCWLGIKLLRAPAADENAEKETRIQDGWASFRQAFAVCLTNPKAIMFFLAFFPLFLTADSHPAVLAVMIAHVSLICLIYQSGLVFVGNAVAVKLSGFRSARLIARRLVGLGLIAFGLKLAVGKR